MIISKTPLRMSFAGGGSDLASFYKKSKGAVISMAIDKYIYVTVNKKFDNDIRLSYSITENVKDLSELKHTRVKATLGRLDIKNGIEITSIADIPSTGTGLGSSSSFTVGLLNALYAYQSKFSTPSILAKEGCEIEIVDLQEPIGKQDQYAAAYGGFNIIEFMEDESVFINPIICKKETLLAIENNILMFYTGITRNAGNILATQNQNTQNDAKKFEIMKQMVELVYTLKEELQKNNTNSFGKILHENWQLKKEMAVGVSNAQIDNWYEKAVQNGALGGKLLGAGGGGFLIFYVPKNDHAKVTSALSDLRQFDFKFEFEGSKIIFIH